MVDRTEKTVTEIIDETYFIDGEDKDIQTERELRGFDKAIQTISRSLKKDVAEQIKTEIHIDMEYGKLK